MDILLAILLGFGGGYFYNNSSCPEIRKPTTLPEFYIEDCMGNCGKEFSIKLTPKTRGQIDNFARECINYEETTNKLIDSYNKVVK
jgi:hypothetical protein